MPSGTSKAASLLALIIAYQWVSRSWGILRGSGGIPVGPRRFWWVSGDPRASHQIPVDQIRSHVFPRLTLDVSKLIYCSRTVPEIEKVE
ncbi:hypothetical protein TURU_024634 [Turdus rufiventris]|nr:hypothetical protein TURU_024634 [Turdus rufiventris]